MLHKTSEMKYLLPYLLTFLFSANNFSQTILMPRTPAEFEEMQGVLICWFENQYLSLIARAQERGSWTQPARDQYDGLMNTQAAIIQEVLNEGLEVYVIDDTSHNSPYFGKVYNEYHVADTLAMLGIESSSNLHIILAPNQPPHTVWSRDWGPLTVYQNQTDSAYLAGWLYTSLIADYLQRPFIVAEELMDGGNFLTDGHGRIFLSSLQPDIDLNLFGITDSIRAAQYKIHIDYWLKMIDEETFFINEIPPENYLHTIDYLYADDSVLHTAIDRIKQKKSCYKRPYRFIKIRTAPTFDNHVLTYITSECGYVNSLIINRAVLVPQYDNPETDSVALNSYRHYMPGYRIVGIPAKHFAVMGGTIHCITKEIPVSDPVFIAHAWLSDTLQTAVFEYEIKAFIRTRSGIGHAEVYWTTNPAGGFQAVTMNPAGADTFTAYIPAQAGGTRIFYYITATSNSGRTWQKPPVAPAGYYSFVVTDASTIARNESLPPNRFKLLQNLPNPFNPRTRIYFELPEELFADLRVYNILGQEVAVLVKENRPAGQYDAVFDGSWLPSGVYFYKLQAGDYVKSAKCLLIK
jgi:agmatine deiminase